MTDLKKFSFERARGLIWVCDVAASSSRLNSDTGVIETEEFLPRLYWIANLVIKSAGGEFIKWTGDGFLAWFETPLHRDLHQAASRCLEALWHLTVMVNVTQLGLKPRRRFKIRHGLTYEHDALLIKITHLSGFEMLDIIGRSVVMAFRLSGVTTDFPCVTTQREVVEALGSSQLKKFRRWKPNADESLRYFKGERWGTTSLFVSVEKPSPKRSHKAITKMVDVAIRNAKGAKSAEDASVRFSTSVLNGLKSGPQWGIEVAESYLNFIGTELLANLEAFREVGTKRPNQ
jgi:class 3 adenylate cyclase